MRLLDTDTRLTPQQAGLLHEWLPGAVIEADHTWDLGARLVLQVRHDDQVLTVKAGGAGDHHMDREITAHHQWLGTWTQLDRAPRLVHADASERLLVTTYLPGELVLGSPAQEHPGTFDQAGELLGMLHRQESLTDEHWEATANARSLAWLDGEHRIDSETEAALRQEIAAWPTPPVQLVPTHGDWQPRNWLIHQGRVSIIDFGRADLRPALTDLGRLAAQDFPRDPALEAAFLSGYGDDPREPEAWHRVQVREAVGTAVWAHQVGDADFEAQGHAMIGAALGS